MRKWIANRLVRLARKIHPENEEVMKFWSDRMMDLVITGQSTIKIGTVPPGTIFNGSPAASTPSTPKEK